MVGGRAARRCQGIRSRVIDSSHPINVQMLVDYTELEMQEERELSLCFFPPFVFLHRKISTDLRAPTHPTCFVLGMPGATGRGWGGHFRPHRHGMGRVLSFPTCWISAARNLVLTHIPGLFFRYWPWVGYEKQSRTSECIPSVTTGALIRGHVLWSSCLQMPGSPPHCHKGLRTPSTTDTNHHPLEMLEGGSAGLPGWHPHLIPASLHPSAAQRGEKGRGKEIYGLSKDTALTGGSLQLAAQPTDSNSLSSSLKQFAPSGNSPVQQNVPLSSCRFPL